MNETKDRCGELSRKGKRLFNEFCERFSSELQEDWQIFAVQSCFNELLLNHPCPPIRFIKLEEMVALGTIPRYPDNENITHDIRSIERNNSLVVFISHNWMRGDCNAKGWDGKSHPDNAAGDKFKLCCKGIREIKELYAPRMKECYVWIDFGCMNQDNKDLSSELEHYDKIVEYCDCVYTPLVGESDGVEENLAIYIDRAWCRVEMMYAANIPVLENANCNETKRFTLFEDEMSFHCSENRRPHFVSYKERNGPPNILPPFQLSYFTEFHPLKGKLTNPSDVQYIALLVSDLQRYIDEKIATVGYKGDVNDEGQPQGHGSSVLENGDRYDGEWRDGKRNGHGTCRFATGHVYEGQWQDDKRHGHGTYRFAAGGVYVGEWKDNKENGHGTCRFSDGSAYIGEWKDGNKHGHGTFRYTDGGEYEGEWKDDKNHGYGICRYAKGSVYEGEWQERKKHGRGTCRYAHGAVYDGEWQNDKKHGRGTLQADGSVYEGEWQGDLMHGHGVCQYSNGEVYEGEWQLHKRHGQGTLRSCDETIYSGEWMNGKPAHKSPLARYLEELMKEK